MRKNPFSGCVSLRLLLVAFFVLVGCQSLRADLFMRVVDTGAGLCCVIRTHGNKYIVYDFGHWNAQGYRAYKGVKDMIPVDQPISLVVLSHSDSDHLGGAKRVFDEYQVDKVVRSGFERTTATWMDTNQSVEDEPGSEDVNRKNDSLPDPVVFDDTTVTFVAGWHEPPSAWGLSGGEFRNAGSICIRIEYAGKSILLCGDAVGRHLGDSPDSCIATEVFMCDNAASTPIASDIIVAPHHGADNGSSTRFVQEVAPTWVIFSSGHAHQHPTYSAAKRYMDNGVAKPNMFRTDLGDHEPGPYEWWHGREFGNVDPPGDDDVDVRIKPSGFISVKYRHDNSLSFTDPAAAPWNSGVPSEVLRQESLPVDILERQEYGDDFVSEHTYAVPRALRTVTCEPPKTISSSRGCRRRCRIFSRLRSRRCRR